MKSFRLVAALGLLCVAPAFAGNAPDVCSTRMLAGRWMFATDIGHQSFLGTGQDITAIGTFRFDRQGTLLDGVFDATVFKTRFLPGITFTGDITINPDCTGTLYFVTSTGRARTDSVIVLGPGHIRGMSQDIENLWTYEMRRL